VSVASEISARAMEHRRLAIDTEFVSERRYQAQLCLVQVAVPDEQGEDGVRTEVLDPLDESTALDPAPLAAALADPEVQVVMHAGRQDVAILRRTWETDITNVFDTQVAAGFLGFGNQEGYEQLVRRVLGVQLKGGEGFTRWDKRPLTDKQLSYAGDDARCLLALGDAVERDLTERGRLAWAREESAIVEGSDDVRGPKQAYERLPKLGRMEARQRAVAMSLCRWRDGVARKVDRPPPSVVPDQTLVELARRAPKDRAALENIRGLPQQTLHRRADELLSAIARGREEEAPLAPESGPRRDSSNSPLISLAQAVLRQRSAESKVATELIATQSELAALVASVRRDEDGTRVRALRGWRRELVGEELEALIAGRLQVRVDDKGRLEVGPA
jgi:ribonuclease D